MSVVLSLPVRCSATSAMTANRVTLWTWSSMFSASDIEPVGLGRGPAGHRGGELLALGQLGRGGRRDDLDLGRLREVLSQPVAALGEGLGLGVNPANLAPLAPAEQAMVYAELDLGPDLDVGQLDEHLERVGDPAVGRVFQGDDAELDVPPVDLLEDGGDRSDRNVLDGLAKFRHRGQVAVAVLRTQAGDAQVPLERPGSAHELAEDQAERLGGQGTLAGGQGPCDDLVLTRRRPDLHPLMMLDLSNLRGDRGPAVEQLDQVEVELVDLSPQARQGGGPLRVGRLAGRSLCGCGVTIRWGGLTGHRSTRRETIGRMRHLNLRRKLLSDK